MSHSNVWSNPSLAGATDIAQMAAHLEASAKRPDMRRVNQALLEQLELQRGERVVEIGCGTGVLSRMTAPLVMPGGWQIGLDISPEMILFARSTARKTGLSVPLQFLVGSAEWLPLPAACCDVAYAARLLLHVQDPLAVLSEMMRLVRPGGRLVLMDWDFGTLAIDHPDRELTRLILDWRSDHQGGENWSGRRLWRYANLAGLANIRLTPMVSVARNEQDGLTQSLWRAAQLARDAGAITSGQHSCWVEEIKDRIECGIFFASINYYFLRGFAPA